MAVALIVAAGRGERLGSSGPKAFVMLVGGRPMLEWSARRAARRRRRSSGRRRAARPGVAAPRGAWRGGRSAALAVGARGAARAAGEADVVLVHDAARPLVDARPRSSAALAGLDARLPPTRRDRRRPGDATRSRRRRTAPRRAHARPRAPVGGADAAGLPARRARAGAGEPATPRWRPPPTTPGWSRPRGRRGARGAPAPRENLKVTTPDRPRAGRAAAAPARTVVMMPPPC